MTIEEIEISFENFKRETAAKISEIETAVKANTEYIDGVLETFNKKSFEQDESLRTNKEIHNRLGLL